MPGATFEDMRLYCCIPLEPKPFPRPDSQYMEVMMIIVSNGYSLSDYKSPRDRILTLGSMVIVVMVFTMTRIITLVRPVIMVNTLSGWPLCDNFP